LKCHPQGKRNAGRMGLKIPGLTKGYFKRAGHIIRLCPYDYSLKQLFTMMMRFCLAVRIQRSPLVELTSLLLQFKCFILIPICNMCLSFTNRNRY
jgi:hypothetical protein